MLSVLFAILFFFTGGYNFGNRNHVVFLPVIRVLLGESPHLAGDFNVLQYWDYHINFNYLCAFFSRFLGIETAFLSGYWVTLVLFGASIIYLTRGFFRDRLTPALVLLALVFWDSHGLERNSFWFNHMFEAQSLAWPFVIFSAGCLVRSKFIPAALLAAFAAALHIQMGFVAGVCVFMVLVFQARRLGLRRSLTCLLVEGLAFVPVLIQRLTQIRDVLGTTGEAFFRHAYFRNPHHFLLHGEKSGLFLSLAVLGCALFIVMLTRESRGNVIGTRHRMAAGLFGCLMALAMLHYLDMYWFLWGNIAKLQMIRMSPLMHLLAVIYACAFTAKACSRPDFEGRAAGGFLFFSLIPVFLSEQAFDPWRHLLPSCLFLLSAAVLSLWPSADNRKGSGLLLLGVFLFLAIGLKFDFPFAVTGSMQPARKVRLFHGAEEMRNRWKELCQWVEKNTGREDIFITPPDMEGFTSIGDRKMIVEYKVTTHNRKEYEVEWIQRLEDLAQTGDIMKACSGPIPCKRYLKRRYEKLTNERVQKLAVKYGAGYFVTYSDRTYDFPLLYRNAIFSLYQLEAENISDGDG